MNLFELLSKPSQMVYWSKQENIINFLEIQAYFRDIASDIPSEESKILRECIAQLEALEKKEVK